MRLMFVGLTIMVIGASVAADAQELAPARAQEGINLTLTAQNAEFILGEPVTLHVSLQNKSNQPVQVARNLKPEYGDVLYLIGRSPTDLRAFSPWALKEVDQPLISLSAGESLEQDADLFFDGRRWTFDATGRYFVQAVYLDRLRSNVLGITIAPPRNTEEKFAAETMLDSSEAGRFILLKGGDHLKNGMVALERVVQAAPGTPHAQHARLVLGLNQLQPFIDYGSNQVRQANPQLAIRFLEGIDFRPLGAERSAEAVLGRAKAHRILMHEAEANAQDLIRQKLPAVDPKTIQERVIPGIVQGLQ